MSHTTAARARRRLRRFALLALVTNVLIVCSGGLVRVTGSGLGCPTWPRCDEDSFVPTPGGDHAGWQTAVEFGNRLLTFVVLTAVIAVFVQVRRTRPHRRDVEVLAWTLPIGVMAQAVLGGVTVLTGLSPVTVATHFLLSMLLVGAATALHDRVRGGGGTAPGRGVQHATSVLAVIAFAVLTVGTIVTGAGPHGGDLAAPRFGVDIRTVALAHADLVWLLLGITIALVAVTWRSGPPPLRTALRTLLAIELAQGAIGYTQYVLGVPEVLVALHILGAALLWTAAVAVWVRARPVPARDTEVLTAEPEQDALTR